VCDDRELERKVAIKIVNTRSNIESLRREIAILSDIRSPHVAEVYDFIEAKSGKQIGLVQQFVSGSHLHEESAQPGWDQVLAHLYQLATGISHIHGHNVIHRDLKPSNIRFDEEGVLKVLDFGLSQTGSSQHYTTKVRGTTSYIAPELFMPPPAQYTNKVDVYAFGVIAYL